VNQARHELGFSDYADEDVVEKPTANS